MTNFIVITVDNAANETVYPQMADFTFYGGLYRDVNILAVSESYFNLDYCGGPGIKVTPAVEIDPENGFILNGDFHTTYPNIPIGCGEYV